MLEEQILQCWHSLCIANEYRLLNEGSGIRVKVIGELKASRIIKVGDAVVISEFVSLQYL